MCVAESGFRRIDAPLSSHYEMHAAIVSMWRFAQRRVLRAMRWTSAEYMRAYAIALETVKERARRAVPIAARCTCGLVEVRASSGARHVFTCHCTACAEQTKSCGSVAPTWTAVSRNHCVVRGALDIRYSSSYARRANCAECGDAILMDYSAQHTLYVANALPAPADIAAGDPLNGELVADADIYWKSRRQDAKATSQHVFDTMPLAKMGFVFDPGRSLHALEVDP